MAIETAPAAGGESYETFIQRQRRLQGEQNAALTAPTSPGSQTPSTQQTTQQASPPAASSTPATPVTGSGKIPEPTAPATPQQQQATPAPQTQDPFASVGGGVFVNGGWIPKAMATAQQQQPASAPAPQVATNGPQFSGPLQPVALGNDPFKTYQASQFNVPIPELGNLPASYAGSNISQFTGPDQAQTQQMQNTLLQAILGNPETMNPGVLGALKEKQKEAALLQAQQARQAAMQFAASRGRTNGGGLAGLLAQIQGQTGDSVINSNRELDIAALQHNRQDQLNALQAAEGVLSGQMGRASSAFQNTLTGQTAQAADSRSAAQDAIARALAGNDAALRSAGLNLQQQGLNAEEQFRQFQTERSAQDAALQRILSQFGVNQAVVDSGRADRALDLNAELGRGGLSLDQQRLAQQGSQFDQGFGLDVLRFLEGQRQADNSLGFNYNQLASQGQNNTINTILSILGGR